MEHLVSLLEVPSPTVAFLGASYGPPMGLARAVGRLRAALRTALLRQETRLAQRVGDALEDELRALQRRAALVRGALSELEVDARLVALSAPLPPSGVVRLPDLGSTVGRDVGESHLAAWRRAAVAWDIGAMRYLSEELDDLTLRRASVLRILQSTCLARGLGAPARVDARCASALANLPADAPPELGNRLRRVQKSARAAATSARRALRRWDGQALGEAAVSGQAALDMLEAIVPAPRVVGPPVSSPNARGIPHPARRAVVLGAALGVLFAAVPGAWAGDALHSAGFIDTNAATFFIATAFLAGALPCWAWAVGARWVGPS